MAPLAVIPATVMLPLDVALVIWSLPKISKTRWVFPHQGSLLKLNYLALDRIAKKWTMPIANWCEALNHFGIEFGDRMPRLD